MLKSKRIDRKASSSRSRNSYKPKRPGPFLPPKERTAKIEQTLDTVLNDLITQGRLSAEKAHVFKTPEMREHIGKMCDRIHRRKHGYPEVLPEDTEASTLSFAQNNPDWPTQAVVPNSELSVVRPPKKDSSTTRRYRSRKRSSSRSRRDKSKGNPGLTSDTNSKTDQLGNSKTGAEKHIQHLDSSNMLRDEAVDHIMMKANAGTALKRLSEKFDPSFAPNKAAECQAYCATIDLRGFSDDHISLELDGRRLIVVAQRPQNEALKIHARKVIEVIDIPDGIDIANLKVGRGTDGSMIIEEYTEASVVTPTAKNR